MRSCHIASCTVEYLKYKVMQEILGSKVRHIIPPIEVECTFNAGLVRSAECVEVKVCQQSDYQAVYPDDPKC